MSYQELKVRALNRNGWRILHQQGPEAVYSPFKRLDPSVTESFSIIYKFILVFNCYDISTGDRVQYNTPFTQNYFVPHTFHEVGVNSFEVKVKLLQNGIYYTQNNLSFKSKRDTFQLTSHISYVEEILLSLNLF